MFGSGSYVGPGLGTRPAGRNGRSGGGGGQGLLPLVLVVGEAHSG